MTVFKNKKGFTLLEIMVSITIIAIVIVSLFSLQSASIDLAGKTNFKSTAPFLARKQLALIEQDIATWTAFEGDFQEPHTGYTWTCNIGDADFGESQVIEEANNKTLKKIDLEIKGQEGSSVYSITTYRYVNFEDDKD